MKIKTNILNLARVALVVGAAALSVPSASAVLTGYSAGDVFLGFRQDGAANTLAVNLGSVTQFLTPALGGTWDGNPFTVQFGFVPNTATPVTNLNADLTSVFGASWATNNNLGTGVRWAVVGQTNNALDNTPINGYTNRTIFATKQRTNPGIQSAAPTVYDNDGFGAQFNSFANAASASAYKNQTSTANSSVAYIGGATGVDNWNQRIGANGQFLSGWRVEQNNSGAFSGPTNSVLDFYLVPNIDSTLATDPTFLGTFTLNSSGQLTFSAVPEPSTYALLAIAGTVFMVFVRRRNRASVSLN